MNTQIGAMTPEQMEVRLKEIQQQKTTATGKNLLILEQGEKMLLGAIAEKK